MPVPTTLASARRELTRHRHESGKHVLRAARISKELRSGGSEFFLRDITVELVPGDILGIVGPNASGKSTLLEILAGRLRQDAGTLTYPAFGTGATDWRTVRQRIAFVPQELKPWPGRLVDHLRLSAAARGVHGARNEREVMFALYRLGLEEYQNHAWSALSGGYKVRFELARALVSNPSIMILDEPLAPLDIHAQQLFLEDLSDLAASVSRPVAVVVSSQHLHEIESIATHMLFLEQGIARYSGERQGMFEERATDLIEFECSHSADSLRTILEPLGVTHVRSLGPFLTVEFPRALGRRRILQTLLEKEVEISYFRDVSQSSRRYFGEREDGDDAPR